MASPKARRQKPWTGSHSRSPNQQRTDLGVDESAHQDRKYQRDVMSLRSVPAGLGENVVNAGAPGPIRALEVVWDDPLLGGA